MINLEKIKSEKCQSHPSLLKIPAPAPYFHPLILIFYIPPPPPWEVTKIYLVTIWLKMMK